MIDYEAVRQAFVNPSEWVLLWARLTSELGRRAGKAWSAGRHDEALGLMARQARARDRFWEAVDRLPREAA